MNAPAIDSLQPRGWCTFRLGEQWYALPVERVREVLRPAALTPLPGAPASVLGLLHLRGQIVTALDARPCLGLPSASEGPRPQLLVHDGDTVVSLLVDAIGDVYRAPANELRTPPTTLPASVRECLLGLLRREHDLLLVVDLDTVLEHAFTFVPTNGNRRDPLTHGGLS